MRKVILTDLKQVALNSKETLWQQAKSLDRDVKLYLHWSAGHYDQFFDDYHINIGKDGSIYLSTNDLSTHLSHTYMRNTGAIGVAIACCAFATTNDLGQEPPTIAQIESMAQVVAILCKALDLTCDKDRVMTHCEAANNLDGFNPGYEDNGYPDGKYGPGFSCERWDLYFLANGDKPWSGGDIIRGKANFYINQGV